MNFLEAEQFLLSLRNIPRKDFIKKNKNCQICLDRLNYFLSFLGNPQNKIPHYIHITGTSGKGSLTTYLHSILHTAGKKVGSTQSPHPTKITEHWKVATKNMTDKEFENIVKIIKVALEKYISSNKYDIISYSEVLTAIGLLFFYQKNVEWAIIEVGLGGRYDSTNIIPNKDIAIITNIGLDHEKSIGPTKKAITYEKSGIIKPNTKIFTMVSDTKLLNIINNECKKNIADIKIIKKNNFKIINFSINKTQFNYLDNEYVLTTPGIHQINNALIAIEVSKYLNIPINTIKKGQANTKQILRLELFYKNQIILDGAHNKDKMKSTVDFIKKINEKNEKNIHILIGFSENKKYKQMIKMILDLNPKSIAISRNTNNPFRKVASPIDIKKECNKKNTNNTLHVFVDPEKALDWSMKKIKKNDILLITGSIFLSGQIRPLLTKMKL